MTADKESEGTSSKNFSKSFLIYHLWSYNIIYHSTQSYDNDNNYKLLGFAHELRTFIGQGR